MSGLLHQAMRLMQQSGHIGKILVRPAPAEVGLRTDTATDAFAVDPNRTQLISGGLGGFGLAAAEWLIDRGARHLALLGRTGAASDAARAAVATFRGRGVDVRVDAVDVTDYEATRAFLTEVGETMPPLGGVVHAAMTLDDAVVGNLDESRLLKVLNPKITGADNLDRLTRNLPLDFFLLFSSATTIIGNPGQGAYVAANGYLQGLARRRRSEGLPALALAWGAIADVGVLARHSATRDSLVHRAGVNAIKARAALDALGEALALPRADDADATLVIADVKWSAARTQLPLLNSPTFSRLGDGDGSSAANVDEVVNLGDLVTRSRPDEARRVVIEVLVEEIARILRLPRDDVSRTKPLAEIGLDSLMAVELTLSLETRFGLDAPLGASAGGFNVSDLAAHLLATVRQEDQQFDLAEDLAKRHLEKAEWGEIAPLVNALQEQGVDLTGAQSHQSASA
jgi:NAD(P)-dependent dehydrogenase (short-subunit alcohol dehydrogenase family)/acyl carrier protein